MKSWSRVKLGQVGDGDGSIIHLCGPHIYDFWRITILYIYKLPLYYDQYHKINHVGHHKKGILILCHMLYDAYIS